MPVMDRLSESSTNNNGQLNTILYDLSCSIHHSLWHPRPRAG